MALVYVLRNPMKKDEFGISKIFYVGMSMHDSDKRPKDHIREANREGNEYNPYKSRTIRQIQKAGFDVDIDILEQGLTKELACELEIFLIDFIGRRSEGKQLCNITKGGDGNTSPRTKEDLIRLKKQSQDRWDVASKEEKQKQGLILRQGFKKKLEKDIEFNIKFCKIQSDKANIPKNIKRLQELGRRKRGSEADRLGYIKSAITRKAMNIKHSRCSCLICRKEIGTNILASSHGENKCNGNRYLNKDMTGNKGKYNRIRASCIICGLETIVGRLMVHFNKSSCYQ